MGNHKASKENVAAVAAVAALVTECTIEVEKAEEPPKKG